MKSRTTTVGVVRRAIIALLLLASLSCSGMGSDEAELFYAGPVVTRSQAKAMLRAGIAVNTQLCPENTNAGYWAIENDVPALLDDTHYDKHSIETCFIVLASASCGLNPDANQSVFLSLYKSLIRLCNPRSVRL